jgi:hypothetical protein
MKEYKLFLKSLNLKKTILALAKMELLPELLRGIMGMHSSHSLISF